MKILSKILSFIKKGLTKAFTACKRVHYFIIMTAETTEEGWNKRLFDLVEKDNHLMLSEYQKGGANFHIYNAQGHTLLFAAYLQARLLKKFASFFYLIKTLNGVPEIFRLVAQNDVEAIKKCLQTKPNVNFHLIGGVNPRLLDSELVCKYKTMNDVPNEDITVTLGLLDILFITKNNQVLHLLLDNGLQFFSQSGISSFEVFKKYICEDLNQLIRDKIIHYPNFAYMIKEMGMGKRYTIKELKQLFNGFIAMTIMSGNTLELVQILFDGFPVQGFNDSKMKHSPLYLAQVYNQKYIINVLKQFGANIVENKLDKTSESKDKGDTQVLYPHCELSQIYWYLTGKITQCSDNNHHKQACKKCCYLLNKPIYFDLEYTREISAADFETIDEFNFHHFKLPENNYLIVYNCVTIAKNSRWKTATRLLGEHYVILDNNGKEGVCLKLCQHCNRLEVEPKDPAKKELFCFNTVSEEKYEKMLKAQNRERQVKCSQLVSECESLEYCFTADTNKARDPERHVADHLQESLKYFQQISKDMQSLNSFLTDAENSITGGNGDLNTTSVISLRSLKKDNQKALQKATEANKSRLMELNSIKADIIKTLEDVKHGIEAFHAEYENSHILVEHQADKGALEQANTTLEKIKNKAKEVTVHFKQAVLLREKLSFCHAIIIERLEKLRKAQDRHNREKKDLEDKSLSLAKQITALDEQHKQEEKLAQEAAETAAREEAARKVRFKQQREEYRRMRDSLNSEIAGPTEKPKTIAETNDSFYSKKPKPLTLNRKADIIFTIEKHDAKKQAEKEINLLILCIEACVEMNLDAGKEKDSMGRTTQSDLEKKANNDYDWEKNQKIQREALLATLARCMEVIKQLKGEQNLPQDFARRLRNYFFKSRRFLIPKKETVKEAKQINEEIIDMVNDLIFLLRNIDNSSQIMNQKKDIGQKADIGRKKGVEGMSSRIFQEMRKESYELEQEKPLSIDECFQGIKIANGALEAYGLCEDVNALLLFCAQEWQRAALGTFAALIRDYSKLEGEGLYFKNKKLYDQYIEQGKQFRHCDLFPLTKKARKSNAI